MDRMRPERLGNICKNYKPYRRIPPKKWKHNFQLTTTETVRKADK